MFQITWEQDDDQQFDCGPFETAGQAAEYLHFLLSDSVDEAEKPESRPMPGFHWVQIEPVA